MAKRILVLSGNPKAVSFSGQLAEAYKEAAQHPSSGNIEWQLIVASQQVR